MAHRPHILLVDDEADLIEALGEYLTDVGFEVALATSGAAALRLLDRQPVDAVVMDLGMPGESGLDLLRHLREGYGTTVLVLTANTDPVDRIAGLEGGADDLLVKPVDPQELAARLGGILQRRGAAQRDLVRLERTSVDLSSSRLLRFGQKPQRLGPGEVMLVRALVRHPNRVLSRDELMDMAPAESLDVNDRAIDTRMARLRRKLDTKAIVTVRGHGYMFVPPFEAGG